MLLGVTADVTRKKLKMILSHLWRQRHAKEEQLAVGERLLALLRALRALLALLARVNPSAHPSQACRSLPLASLKSQD